MKLKQEVKVKIKLSGSGRPPKEWEKNLEGWLMESKALTRIYRIQRLIWNDFGFNEE